MSWKGIAAVVTVAAILYGIDLDVRAGQLRSYDAHPAKDISDIVRKYGPAVNDCKPGTDEDLDALAASFLTVETFATPVLSGWARSAIMALGSALDMPPDISFGPGRIRLSTARSALIQAGSTGTGHSGSRSDREIVYELMTACGSLRIAVEILKELAAKKRPANRVIDRSFVRDVAREYNGQRGSDAMAAHLSAEIYFDLVYNSFQYFRFAALLSRDGHAVSDRDLVRG